ncbi:MAG TPA: hypothetical protein VN048_16405 [Verrucomicrobiae bacterium]|jgi:hypothetical protein|nr:hypothetical protein [Verrucomicrobiae bacterium]
MKGAIFAINRAASIFFTNSLPVTAQDVHVKRGETASSPSSMAELKRPRPRFARKIVKYFTN